MILARRLALQVLPLFTAVSLADAPLSSQPPVDSPTPQVVVVEEEVPRQLAPELEPTPLPARRVVVNPPSRVIQGPLVRRVVPSRHARPFNRGASRYEPKLGDIRNLPRDLTLPGSEGERETLYSLPPRDRGYFILPRY